MAYVPAPVVSAPEPRGLRYGLFTAATGPLALPEPSGLGGGVQYEPASCGIAHLYPVECDGAPPTKVFDPADPLVTASPFLAYASLQCGSAGSTSATLEAKVRRRLANGEQTIAEQGLATALTAAASHVAAPDPSSIASVIGELEQWLYGIATANYGNIGFLHAPPRFAVAAASEGMAVKDGPLWRTPMGTIWVFGGGYPDNGAVHISGNVTVWRAANVFVPDPQQTFDRVRNQYHLIAEREYAVAFDCVAADAQYTPVAAS